MAFGTRLFSKPEVCGNLTGVEDMVFVKYTVINTTDLMHNVGFISLIQSRHQVVLSLLASRSIKFVKIRLDATLYLQTCCKLFQQLEGKKS